MANFGALFDHSKDRLSNGRLAEEGVATPGLIEHAVHCDERLAGGQMRGRKRTMCRETVMQAEGDEQGTDNIEMRESAPFQHHVG